MSTCEICGRGKNLQLISYKYLVNKTKEFTRVMCSLCFKSTAKDVSVKIIEHKEVGNVG